MKTLHILSPHLDDAIFSLGATIASTVRAGVDVRIITVFAGDIASGAPAGPWDRRADFATEGDAASARREEDRRACEILGATPVWLPYGDEQYGSAAVPDDELRAAILAAIPGDEPVLVPGFPLIHPDHARVAALIQLDPLAVREIGHYVEQPYASKRGLPASTGWVAVPLTEEDRRAKHDAMVQYRSQLQLLSWNPRRMCRRIGRYERANGGELTAWQAGASGVQVA